MFQRLGLWLLFIGILANCTANAQEVWTFEEGQTEFQSMVCAYDVPSFSSNYLADYEQTIILRSGDTNNNYRWLCFELPTLKKLFEIPEPTGWNWGMYAISAKYACSFVNGQVQTIDLQTGRLLKPVTVRPLSNMSILFDKAIVVDSGTVLALPSFNLVPNHPLVNTTFNPYTNLLASFTPIKANFSWRLDANRWVVSGLIFGPDMKPQPAFVGNYAWRGMFPTPRDETREGAINPGRQGTSSLTITRQGKPVANAVCKSSSKLAGSLTFYPMGQGYLGQQGTTLVYLAASKANPVTGLSSAISDIDKYPMPIPPLIVPGGDFTPVRFLADKPAVNCTMSSSLQVEQKFENQQLLVKPQSKEWMLNNTSLMNSLTRQVEALSKVSADASWEAMIAAYKANNMRWLVPYATAMKVRFSGIPIEMPCEVVYAEPGGTEFRCLSSFIVDMPEDSLKPFRTKDLPASTYQPSTDKSGQEYLQLVANREQAQTVTIESRPVPEPPQLGPLPTAISPDSVQGSFRWISDAHPRRLVLTLVRIFINYMALMLTIWLVNQTNAKVQMVGQPALVAMLVACACVFFDTGSVLFIDYFTEAAIGEDAAGLAVRATIKILLSSIFSIFVYLKAMQGSTAHIIVVFVLSGLASNLLPILAALAAVVVLG